MQAGYRAAPLVTSATVGIDQFLAEAVGSGREGSGRERSGRCPYLQQSLLMAGADGALHPCPGLGDGMRRDAAEGIDLPSLRALAAAGGFGPWQRCQLFVGGDATAGARSILHFDQYDNLFVQVEGPRTSR